MAENANHQSQDHLPDAPTSLVRQRWLDLLDLSYAMRRVTQQEIEPGVHAVVVPAPCKSETLQELVEAECRTAFNQVPFMAQGVRMDLGRLSEFTLTLPENYRGGMGARGKDIAAGDTQVTAFVDLAYLEGALLARLWDSGVLVEFGSPLSFFRRGALTDYVNIYESVAAMVAEGRSLADTAGQLAPEVLHRLQLYANAYHQLCSLYPQGTWRIDNDNFVVKVLGSHRSLVLQYWELRGDGAHLQKVMNGWRSRIEQFLQQAASSINHDFPKSFAA